MLNSWTSNMEQSLDIVDVTGIVLLIGWLFWWPIIYYIRRDFQGMCIFSIISVFSHK